jgi:hypothetical protein
MPLPAIIIPFIPTIITVASTALIGSGAKLITDGIDDLVKSGKMTKEMRDQYNAYVKNAEIATTKLSKAMESLGEQRLQVTAGFKHFIDAIARIHNLPPEFEEADYGFDGDIKITLDEIKKASVGASAFLGALGGAAGGGVFAAAGYAGVYGTIMTVGVSSTGTAISGLYGAAAVKAALAALGGGSLAVGGGGIALGTVMLNLAATGIGAIIGGAVFAFVGSKTYKKAMDVYDAVLESEEATLDTVKVINEIYIAARNLKAATASIYNDGYRMAIRGLKDIVAEKDDYSLFTPEEKITVQNAVLYVAALFKLVNLRLMSRTDAGGKGTIVTTGEDGAEAYWLPNADKANAEAESSIVTMKNIKEGRTLS